MEKLTQEFEQSVHFVKNTEGGKKLSNQLKLQMYALYKQATQGDVSGAKPGMLDMIALAKYGAWEKLKGVSNEAAMRDYIAKVADLTSD